jgi:ABC-2 type transport system permease protein
MRWRKVGVVASTEFNSAVRTRAFLISVLFLPLIMVGSIVLQTTVARRPDTTPRTFALIDRTGRLYPAVEAAAAAYNKTVKGRDGKPERPEFHPREADPGGRPEGEFLLELSERVRKGELFAFAVIPAAALDPSKAGEAQIRYYSNTPNDDALPDWLTATINALVREDRLKDAGIEPRTVAALSMPVALRNLTLVDRAAAPAAGAPGEAGVGGEAGESAAAAGVGEAKDVDPIRSALVPAALMFVVFMVVMTTTPQLLQSVIEEKMSRISEVLLGSITPYELMMGKLLGNVGVSLLLAMLYVGGAYAVAAHYGYADAVPPYLLAVTALFIVLAVVLFGSLYLAIGSACSELKDAQSLMMPVMLLSMFPIFIWMAVLRQPNSGLAVGASLFPPATPYLMLLRMALQPPPPAWQVGLSIGLTLLTVLAAVWAAGKIFRVGLLMQGKAPSFAQLAKWVVAR